jgi:hypothetical protein
VLGKFRLLCICRHTCFAERGFEEMSESTKPEETNAQVSDLRELARRIQDETDPAKMIELVQQLIAEFDEQQSRKTRLRTGNGADPRRPEEPHFPKPLAV